MTQTVGVAPASSAGKLRRDALVALLLGLLGWLGPGIAARWARPALLNFGPNDGEYVSGFRSDWERDGRTWFHWTTPSAAVTLPIGFRGQDLKLRMRVRRHLTEPAHVRLIAEGQTVGVFDLRAEEDTPYRTVEMPLPRLEGRQAFVLRIEAPSENPRPLGIAMDWMEVERAGPRASFVLRAQFRLAVVAATLLAFLLPRLAGAPWWIALLHAAGVTVAASLGTLWDVIAAERILRLGWPCYAAVGLLGLGLVRWRRARAFLMIDSAAAAGSLVAIVLVALGVRLVLLLHPGFYYPDVRIHALFALQLAKDGLPAFLREFTINQYRHSLGLQLVNGHWYAFPYPPVFYILCWPLLRLAHFRPEVAVAALAAAANSLEALLVFAFAGRLRGSAAVGLAAAAAVPLLPLFSVRLTLAYFPAIVGHAVDAVLLLWLLSRLGELERPRVVLAAGALLAMALLTYTQSLLNLGILLPLFLGFQVALDRTREGWRRHLGLAAAGALGLVVAMAVFYGRYVPIFLDMQRGVPMAEERVLIEKMERSRPDSAETPKQDADDPFAGPGIDLARGLRKAGWRLWIFYGPFAPFVVAGVILVARRSHGAEARLVAAWALTYVLLNLASGGLPGPNLVRYNKDLELVAPLFCVGLGALGLWMWERGRAWAFAALVYGTSFLAFGAARAVRSLSERFVLER